VDLFILIKFVLFDVSCVFHDHFLANIETKLC